MTSRAVPAHLVPVFVELAAAAAEGLLEESVLHAGPVPVHEVHDGLPFRLAEAVPFGIGAATAKPFLFILVDHVADQGARGLLGQFQIGSRRDATIDMLSIRRLPDQSK